MRFWFFLLLPVLLPSLTRAERLPIRTYTTADGLAHNEINKIVRDSRGFLWFCTSGGLSRFDGYAFTNFGTDQGLPNLNVTNLLETREGEYWVATNGGLVRFDPRTPPEPRVVFAGEGNSRALPMFAVILPPDDDRRSRAVNVVFEDHEGTLWCGTNKGLYRLERTGDHFVLQSVDIGIPQVYPEQGFILDLLEDAHGSLWLATANGLYRRFSDGSSARYTRGDGLPDDYLQSLLADREGQLWIATRYAGFFSVIADDTHAAPIVKQWYGALDGLNTSWVVQVYEAADRRFWIATNLGLVEFFPNAGDPGQRFHAYTTRNGLSYHELTALNEDSGGNLWLGTNAVGAMKLTRNGFITYDEQDGWALVNAIFADRAGGICFRGWVVGDAQGGVATSHRETVALAEAQYLQRLGRFDGERFTWFIPRSLAKENLGWVGEHVTLQARNGEFWIGTANGVYRFPGTDNFAAVAGTRPLEHFTEQDGLAAPQVFRLFEDSRGEVWISTISSVGNGLARWERDRRILHNMADTAGLPSLKDNLARSFGEDAAGNVWVGFSDGLARYRDGNFSFFNTNEGLPPGGVMEIHSDRAGRLWLASSSGGLVRVDNLSAERPGFVTYTTAQGLSSNSAEVITEDLLGHIYVGTGRGLDRLDPASGQVEHFTTADGLAPGEFRAAFCDREGTLWFGTQKGLSRLTPASAETERSTPIVITSVLVAGTPGFVSALGETELTIPDLSPNQNGLQINFVGLSFAPGEVLHYQYKLGSGEWSGPTEQRVVNFANLSAGSYRFMVRAVNSEGAISAAPAVVAFKILPPLWLRWWFLTLVALALGATVFAAYRYRVARLLEVANMRTRIATDLHDDIGANLTRITLLSEVAKQQFGNGEDRSSSPLSSIANIARESVASMNDIVWAISPDRDSLRDLTRRMRQHADEVFTLRDIDLEFRTPGPEQDLRLGVDLRRDLLLIFKEAVNNAARHSQCSRVKIDFSAQGPWLSLMIADNGVGFNTSATGEGNGLLSMRRRAAKLSGSLQVESRAGQGTTVKLRIPSGRLHRP